MISIVEFENESMTDLIDIFYDDDFSDLDSMNNCLSLGNL